MPGSASGLRFLVSCPPLGKSVELETDLKQSWGGELANKRMKGTPMQATLLSLRLNNTTIAFEHRDCPLRLFLAFLDFSFFPNTVFHSLACTIP
jgi:hypothetical protein